MDLAHVELRQQYVQLTRTSLISTIIDQFCKRKAIIYLSSRSQSLVETNHQISAQCSQLSSYSTLDLFQYILLFFIKHKFSFPQHGEPIWFDVQLS